MSSKYELSPFKVIIEYNGKVIIERLGIIDIPEGSETSESPLIQDIAKLISNVFNGSVEVNKYLIHYLGKNINKIRFYYYKIIDSINSTELSSTYEWMDVEDLIKSDNSSRITTEFISRNYNVKFYMMMSSENYIFHIITKLIDSNNYIKIQSKDIYRRYSNEEDGNEKARSMVSCINSRDKIKCKSIIDYLLRFNEQTPNTTKYYNPLGYYLNSLQLLNSEVVNEASSKPLEP